MATASTAAAKALAIPEILEMVLLQLPPQDLLRCQRVATLWRDSVVRSDKCQRKLFKKPALDSEEWTAIISCDSMPLSQGLFIAQAWKASDLSVRTVPPGQFIVSKPNPLLKLRITEIDRTIHTNVKCTAEEFTHAQYNSGGARSIFTQPLWLHDTDSSFLDMFFSQPPATELYVGYDDDAHPYGALQTIFNTRGVTVRDVVETLKHHLPNAEYVPDVSVNLRRNVFMRDHWRILVDEGIKKYQKLESKVGKAMAFKLVGKGKWWRRNGKDISLMLEGDNLDKIVALCKVEDVANGESIEEVLAEYDRMQSGPSMESEGATVSWEES